MCHYVDSQNLMCVTTLSRTGQFDSALLALIRRLGWLADDDEGRPVFGVGPIRSLRAVDHRQDGFLQRLGVREPGVLGERRKGAGHQSNSAVGFDLPVWIGFGTRDTRAENLLDETSNFASASKLAVSTGLSYSDAESRRAPDGMSSIKISEL
jgi:hypothetical protein